MQGLKNNDLDHPWVWFTSSSSKRGNSLFIGNLLLYHHMDLLPRQAQIFLPKLCANYSSITGRGHLCNWEKTISEKTPLPLHLDFHLYHPPSKIQILLACMSMEVAFQYAAEKSIIMKNTKITINYTIC